MSLLQYTSNEMFSSTELVRKNKKIFDKLNKKEIEKAIILRDGKPAIILLDFNEYEKIMADYLKLKDKKISTQTETKDIKIEEPKVVLEKKDDVEFNFDSNSTKDKDDALKDFWE